MRSRLVVFSSPWWRRSWSPCRPPRRPLRQVGPATSIEVLSNRADLVSAGDALVAVRLPHGVRPGQVRVTVGERDVTQRFAVREDGRFLGLVARPRRRPQRDPGDRARRAGRPGRGHRPPQRRPGLLRPADPALPLPGDRGRRAVQPAGDVRLPLPVDQPAEDRAAALRPEADPPSDVATTTTDQGVEVPFVVRREQGFQDRDRYTILTLFQPGKPWRALGAAAAVEPQAPGHPRRRLRCVVRPGRPAARRLLRHPRRRPGRHAELRHRARPRLRGPLDRARQHRPQLQRRDERRVGDDGQGAPRRAVRRRCATRSAPAARAARSPSTPWPTPTPGSTRA